MNASDAAVGAMEMRATRKQDAADRQAARAREAENARGGWWGTWTLNPRRPWLENWDSVTMAALFFTAIVTPYEVALLETSLNPLFFINRLIDVVFIFDMYLSFLRWFQDEDTGLWVKDFRRISTTYMRGWFAVDVISVIPMDMLAYVLDSDVLSSLKIMRLIRLMRLLKLARVFRASRVLQRWETQMSISYRTLTIISIFLSVAIMSHWLACLWALVGKQISGDPSWITVLEEGKVGRYNNELKIYLASLHFAVMTLTSVGYGDISPQTNAEYFVCIFIMLVSGIYWAYVIGALCSSITNSDPHGNKYKQVMDELNYMSEDVNLTKDLRERMRMYWVKSQHVQRIKAYKGLTAILSPTLQGEVTLTANREWMERIWYLAECGNDFIVELSSTMEAALYPGGERIEALRTLYIIVNRAMAARKGRILSEGDSWGYDMILDNPALIDNTFTVALGFLEVKFIHYERFLAILQKFPEEKDTIRRAKIWITCKKAVQKVAREIKESKGEYVFKTKTVADLGDEYEGQIMSGNRDGAAGGGGGGGVPQAFIDAVKKRFDAQAAALDLAAKAALETQRRLDRLEASAQATVGLLRAIQDDLGNKKESSPRSSPRTGGVPGGGARTREHSKADLSSPSADRASRGSTPTSRRGR